MSTSLSLLGHILIADGVDIFNLELERDVKDLLFVGRMKSAHLKKVVVVDQGCRR